MVALILGVAFFINLAIDRGWLGERERAILGVVAGLALLAAGEYFRNRYPVWAQTVAGGGVAVLYLAVYGAFALYGLIPPVVALASFALITLGGVLLSLRHESVGLAVFSIFGGFATPLLLQKELPDERLLLAYVLVLDMGVLALASFRNWRWFTLLAWIGSLILFGFWMEELEPATPLAEIGITAIFLVFAGATIAFHIVRRQAAGMLDLALVTVNAIAYWLISYALLYDDYRPWMGGFTALLAAFYVLLVAGCQLRGEEQPTLRPYVAGLAAGFAALAVPLQFEGPWISMAWGVEAVALVGLSTQLRMRELRLFGYLVFIVSAVWLLAVESPGAFRDDLTPFLNLYMLSYAAAIALPALAGYLLHRSRETLEPWERMAVPVAAVWAAIFAAIAVPLQLDGIWVSVAWAVEAAALVWLSFPLRLRQLRWFGYLVFAVSAVRLLSSDTPAALNEDLTPFLNLYMLSYAAAVALPALAGYLLHRFREALAPRERAAIPVAAVWAAVFAAIAVPVQLDGIWISIAWGVEAAALVWLSLALRLRELRWFAYLMFAVSAVRLLSSDTPAALNEDLTPFLNLYMLSYAAAVALPALAGYLLHRFRETLAPRERAAIPVAAVWAAVFAAIAVPVQLDGIWISVAWGVEAVALVWLSLALRLRELRWFAYLMFAVSAVRLLSSDTPEALNEDLTPFLNLYMLSYAAAVALPALAGYLLHRFRETLAPRERAAIPVAAVWAAVFAAIAVPVQLDGIWISIAWGVEAVALVWLSFPLRLRQLRWFGYVVFAVSAGWLLAVDTPDAFREDLTPFLNLYMLSYAAAVALPALAGYLLHRFREALAPRERAAIPVAAVWAAVFAAIAVPVQLDGIWISIAWGVEAVALVWLSFPLRLRQLRWFAYLVFAVSAGWLLAVDTPDAFREDLTPFLNLYMLSYAAAVALPALAGYLLHRFREALAPRERAAIPVAAVWAAVFAAIAVPVQLDGIWISVVWGVEAVALVWLSFPLRLRQLRRFAYLVFAVSGVWLLVVDTPDALREDLTPFLNLYMLGYAATIALPALAAYLLHRFREALQPQEQVAIPVAAVWAAAFAVVAVPVQLDGAWIATAWAAEAVLFLALAARLGLELLRWSTYLLLTLMLVRLVAIDTSNFDLEIFRPIINWRFLSFSAGIASLYSAMWLIRRSSRSSSLTFKDEARTAPMVLFAAVTIVSLWILSAEILASADSTLFNLSADVSDNVSVLGLTLLWGIYGGGLMVVGVWRQWRWVRVAGLALLSVSVVKLFAYDSRALEQEFRVIAFVALGLILLAGGLLYQRYSRVIRGFLFE